MLRGRRLARSRIYNLRECARRGGGIYRGEQGRAFYKRGAAWSGVTHDTSVPCKFPKSASHSRIYILIYNTNLQTYSNNHVINLQVRRVCKFTFFKFANPPVNLRDRGLQKTPRLGSRGAVNIGLAHRVRLLCKV